MGKVKKDLRFFHQELQVNIPAQSNPNARKCHHPLIIFYLNYMSIFFIAPFWIKWDSQKGEYVSLTGIYRKVACSLILCWQSFWEVAYIFSSQNPVMNLTETIHELVGMFKLVTHFATMPVSWIITWMLWRRTGKVIKWINAIQGNCSTIPVFFGYLFCATLHCSIVLSYFSNKELFTSIQESSENLENFLVQPGTATLRKVIQDDHFLHQHYHNHSHLEEEDEADDLYPTPLFSFQKFALVMYLLLHSLFRSGETMSLVVVLTLWSFTKTFMMKMRDCSMSVKEGVQLYKRYRCSWNLTNDLFDILILLLYISFVSYYCRLMHWFSEYGIYGFLYMAVQNILLFGLCSHIHYTMHKVMVKWVSERWDDPWVTTHTKLQLHTLSHEVEADRMGVSCNFFTFSYQILGSMIGSLITYSIIVYQNSLKKK